MPTMLRIVTGFVFLIMAGAGAPAQERYPNRIVRIIVPSSAGGVTDILARLVGQGLSQAWGQPVIVDNRPGADQMIGTEAVAKSAPDGYTLLVTSDSSFTAAPHLHKDMRYDPQKDFTPILVLAQITPVLNVPAALPVHSVAELIALLKSKPGALNYGSFGNGTYTHLSMEDFKQRTGTDIMHIPYKGSTPAVTALLRGEVAVVIVNMGNIADHAKAGTVRILAAAGAKRPASRPDLPTIAESGVPGFATGAWWGLFAPANLAPAVVDKIRAEVIRVLAAPEARKVYEANTLEAVDKTPEQFAQLIQSDLAHWGRLIKTVGLKPQ